MELCGRLVHANNGMQPWDYGIQIPDNPIRSGIAWSCALGTHVWRV